jgi:hypothetical protein
VKGAAPGYPAAAARLLNSSCKIEEKRTAPRPRDGGVMTLSGIRSELPPQPHKRHRLERFQAKWRRVRVKKTRQIKNPERRFDSIETEKAPAFAGRDFAKQQRMTPPHAFGKFSSTPTPSGS